MNVTLIFLPKHLFTGVNFKVYILVQILKEHIDLFRDKMTSILSQSVIRFVVKMNLIVNRIGEGA